MTSKNPQGLFAASIPDTREKRIVAIAAFSNTVGYGLVFSAMTLYFTRILGLSIREVGLGLAIAGIAGIFAGMPVGHLGDLRGPREVLRIVLIFQTLVTISWIFIDGFWAFVVVASLELMCFEAYNATNGALLRRVGGSTATTFRSQVRALGNIGLSVGAMGAGIAIAIDTPLAYQVVIGVNASTFAFAWLLLGFLPRYEPLPRPEDEGGGIPKAALKDLPFVAYVAAAGTMSIMYWVITDPLPLWIDGYTTAPLWSVSVFFFINTVLVSVLQVRIGAKVETVAQGGRALRTGGLLFLVACTAIGCAALLPTWSAFACLAFAVVVYTYGEVWFSSGQFAFEFGLPPEHAQGQYQGVSGIGTSLGSAAAPVLMIGLVLSLGTPGWIGAGVLFALIGLTGPAIARWGESTRVEVVSPEAVEAVPEPRPTTVTGS